MPPHNPTRPSLTQRLPPSGIARLSFAAWNARTSARSGRASFRDHGLRGLVGIALVLGVACAQSSSDASPPTQSSPSGEPTPVPNGGAAAVPAAASGGAAEPSAGGQPLEPPSSVGSEDPMDPPEDADVNPCSVAAEDTCSACVCERCSAKLAICDGIAGCSAILECVLASQCLGLDCYCGDKSPPACLQGNANGPCKAVVLAAPGGREPTLTNPSAGPATDAAVALSECAEADDTCRQLCGL